MSTQEHLTKQESDITLMLVHDLYEQKRLSMHYFECHIGFLRSELSRLGEYDMVFFWKEDLQQSKWYYNPEILQGTTHMIRYAYQTWYEPFLPLIEQQDVPLWDQVTLDSQKKLATRVLTSLNAPDIAVFFRYAFPVEDKRLRHGFSVYQAKHLNPSKVYPQVVRAIRNFPPWV